MSDSNEIDLNTVADAYLRNHSSHNDQDFWAWEKIDEIVRSGDLNAAYDVTLLLLNKATSEYLLTCVAAGPLEDLVDGYSDRAIDLLEPACDADERLQFALSGIWLETDSPVLRRWQNLMIKYGFSTGKRRPLSRHPDCWSDSWPQCE